MLFLRGHFFKKLLKKVFIHLYFLFVFAQKLIDNNVMMQWRMTKVKKYPSRTISILFLKLV